MHLQQRFLTVATIRRKASPREIVLLATFHGNFVGPDWVGTDLGNCSKTALLPLRRAKPSADLPIGIRGSLR
jgi:hypothetical protein